MVEMQEFTLHTHSEQGVGGDIAAKICAEIHRRLMQSVRVGVVEDATAGRYAVGDASGTAVEGGIEVPAHIPGGVVGERGARIGAVGANPQGVE